MRVAMLTPPAHGHVNPMLPLAERLVAGGAEVTFAATDEFAAAVGATGATVLPLGDAFRPPPEMFRADAAHGLNPDAAAAFIDRLGEAGADLATRVAALRPDVLVYGVMLGWIAPSLRQIDAPRVVFFPTYAVPDGRVPSEWFAAGGKSSGCWG